MTSRIQSAIQEMMNQEFCEIEAGPDPMLCALTGGALRSKYVVVNHKIGISV